MKSSFRYMAIFLFVCLQYCGIAQADKKPALINHLAIYVTDLQKSGDFYMNVLGLDSIPEPFHDGKHLWLGIGGHASLHIIQGAPTVKEYYKNNHICFSVPSEEDFIEKLKKRAMVFEDIAGTKNVYSTRPDGIKQIWLQDPDGYWIEVNNDYK